jgi:hypothetical protein
MATYEYWLDIKGDGDEAKIACSCGKKSHVMSVPDAEKMLELMGQNAFMHTHRRPNYFHGPRTKKVPA